MELIIFFTNEDKLGVVGVTFPNDLNQENTSIFYKYSFSSEKIILVVNDNIDDTAFKNIIQDYKGISNLYYVHHSLPMEEVRKTIKEFCNENGITLIPQKDIHENGKSKFYHYVGDFCQLNSVLSVQFFDDLKAKFNYDERLEKILALLHECLHHESAAKADISWLEEPQQGLVKQLIKINDNLDPTYIKVLTQLRKDLLGS
jgi:hypothetical protein